MRNSDGSIWDWRKATVRYVALAVGSTYGFHRGFGFAWLTSAVIIALLFLTGGLLWFWAYSRQRL
jgi:hypothetical protein